MKIKYSLIFIFILFFSIIVFMPPTISRGSIDCCYHECRLTEPVRCDGSWTQKCGQCDIDPYNDWCNQTDCAASGKICQNGFCVVSGCVLNCPTGPGCLSSLINGRITSGECCGSGNCYECRAGYIWDSGSRICKASAAPTCIDGTPYNQCSSSTIKGKPWYCNSSGSLIENSGNCGCSNNWVPGPTGTYCCDNQCNNSCSNSGCTAVQDPDCGLAGCCGNGVCNAGESNATCPADCPVISDTTRPTVVSFTFTFSPGPTIAWNVIDTGGSHLARVEVWRAPDASGVPGAWAEVTALRQNMASQNLDSHSGSATDNPGVGIWWYGLHAVDQAGNWGTEAAPQKITLNFFTPTNLALTIRSGYIIDLNWTAPTAPAIDHYVLYLNGQPPYLIYTTSYKKRADTLPNMEYCFTVASVDSVGAYSTQTQPVCHTFAVGTTVTPTNLTATVAGPRTVNLRWNFPITAGQLLLLDPTNAGQFFIFRIERSIDGGSTWSWIKNYSYIFYSNNIPSELTTADSDAAPGATNKYRITALDNGRVGAIGAGTGGFSSASNIANAETPIIDSVPGAPTNLTVTFRSVTTVWLSFKHNSDIETGFVVERLVGGAWADFTLWNYPCSDIRGECSVPTTLNLNTGYELRVRAVNTVGRSDPTNTITITTPGPLSWTEPDPAQNLLIVYNRNLNPNVKDDLGNDISLKDYYLLKRPSISTANVLGVDTTTSLEDIDKASFNSTIRAPIAGWLTDPNNSDKHIRYIVMMYGMPTRTPRICLDTPDPSDCLSVDYEVSVILQNSNQPSGGEYKAGANSRFMPDYYQGTTALVSHLDMGTVAATKAYIDKLADTYNHMANKSVIISGENAGVGGSSYYFDDAQGFAGNPGRLDQDAVLQENPLAQIVYAPNLGRDTANHIKNASNVKGYMTWGANGKFGNDYAQRWVKFSGNSGWYIIQTIESWDGQRFNTECNPGSCQGNFVDWYAKDAFSNINNIAYNTNYKNTPVGAITHVLEPGGGGWNSADYFRLWERGYLFIEAAWASRRTSYFMAIGDPLVTK